jgi:hypothetical protein
MKLGLPRRREINLNLSDEAKISRDFACKSVAISAWHRNAKARD